MKKKLELELELGRRYEIDTYYKNYGELLLIQLESGRTPNIFRSDDNRFVCLNTAELSNKKYQVVPLDTRFDFIWYFMEKSNLDQNLTSSYEACNVVYKHMIPIIKDTTEVLKYYASHINPSECCKLAKKDCGKKARKVIQKHYL